MCVSKQRGSQLCDSGARGEDHKFQKGGKRFAEDRARAEFCFHASWINLTFLRNVEFEQRYHMAILVYRWPEDFSGEKKVLSQCLFLNVFLSSSEFIYYIPGF